MESTSSSLSANLDPTSRSTNVSLAVLMGLPASGKSTLANDLEKFFCSDWRVVLMSFDNFIPLPAQAQIIKYSTDTNSSSNSNSNSSSSRCDEQTQSEPLGLDDESKVYYSNAAKVLRKKFVFCTEVIIQISRDILDNGKLKNANSDGDCFLQKYMELTRNGLGSFGTSRYVSDDDFACRMESIFKVMLCEEDPSNANAKPEKTLIVVDDNNYYHSMRNDFYKIAKTEEIGFCVIYCKAPLKKCLERNSARDSTAQVPPKAIIEMSLKFNEPNPLQNSCDIFSVQIDTTGSDNAVTTSEDGCKKSVNLILLEQVISSTLLNPLKKNDDRTEEIERERRICSENEVHQADLILRKWISKRLNLDCLAKGLDSKSKSEGISSFKKKLSSDLNLRKKHTLEKLRCGELKVSYSVSEDVEFRDEIIKMFQNITL